MLKFDYLIIRNLLKEKSSKCKAIFPAILNRYDCKEPLGANLLTGSQTLLIVSTIYFIFGDMYEESILDPLYLLKKNSMPILASCKLAYKILSLFDNKGMLCYIIKF